MNEMMKPVGEADVVELRYLIEYIIAGGGGGCIPTDCQESYIGNLFKDKRDSLNRGNYSGLKFTVQVFEVSERVMEGFFLCPLLFIFVLQALSREFCKGCQLGCCTQIV